MIIIDFEFNSRLTPTIYDESIVPKKNARLLAICGRYSIVFQ